MANCSVIIPVYNSAASLPALFDEIQAGLPRCFSRYEVIFVNDGSRDDSWAQIDKLCRQHSAIRGINLMRNFGQHNALLCGIREARYEYILTIDDDLQHPLDALPHLLEALNAGSDVVYASPRQQRHGLLRGLASQITKLALQASMGQESARRISAYRLFRTGLREAFASFRGPNANIDVLLTWGTTRFTYREVEHRPRSYGQSNYTVFKLITHALNMITGFSVLPLQIASIMGVALASFSVLSMIYVVARTLLEGTAVPGFAFTASIIGLFSGGQLLALGIIGEYLSRMYFRVIEKPGYVVREFSVSPSQEQN